MESSNFTQQSTEKLSHFNDSIRSNSSDLTFPFVQSKVIDEFMRRSSQTSEDDKINSSIKSKQMYPVSTAKRRIMRSRINGYLKRRIKTATAKQVNQVQNLTQSTRIVLKMNHFSK